MEKHSLEIRIVAAAVYKVTKILVHGCLLIDSNTIQNFVRKEENRQVVFEATLPHGTSGMSLQTLNYILTNLHPDQRLSGMPSLLHPIP